MTSQWSHKVEFLIGSHTSSLVLKQPATSSRTPSVDDPCAAEQRLEERDPLLGPGDKRQPGGQNHQLQRQFIKKRSSQKATTLNEKVQTEKKNCSYFEPASVQETHKMESILSVVIFRQVAASRTRTRRTSASEYWSVGAPSCKDDIELD